MDNISREEYDSYQEKISDLKTEIKRVIVGLDTVINNVLTALLSEGHVLFEGLPGLGKTMLVRTLGQVMDLEYNRIQFTPDLMPADIIGTNILMEEDGRRYFDFQQGPLFSQIVLADEINRATPKTQSALLEAMQESSITVAGKTRQLKAPFFVLATQNPIEMEGTYPLPEAQIDRFFFKINIDYPSSPELKEILNRTTVNQLPEVNPVMTAAELIELQKMIKEMPVSEKVVDFVIKLIKATHPREKKVPEIVEKYVEYGASPRGAQALILAGKANAWLEGRFNVSYTDIKKAAYPALRHRILLNFTGEAAEENVDDIISEIIDFTLERE
ncbi:MAG: AAA family ATPase [Bacillota bacterium]